MLMSDCSIARAVEHSRRRWAVLIFTLALSAACGNNPAKSPSTPVTSQESVREWASPALPAVDRIQQLILDAGGGARSGNVPAFQAATIQIADALAGVQSALVGPLPASAVAESEAFLQSTAEYERASRSASKCDSVSVCLERLKSINSAGDKWADALGALAART